MSLEDKLEIGLEPEAPYRKDNLPAFQQDDPDWTVAATPGDSESLRRARKDCSTPPIEGRQTKRPVARRRTTTGR
jgi:hypothetical protein